MRVEPAPAMAGGLRFSTPALHLSHQDSAPKSATSVVDETVNNFVVPAQPDDT
jgi:hypothetical protein